MSSLDGNSLDCDFYTSFYSDLQSIKSDKFKLHEHYLEKSKTENRIANVTEFGSVICDLVKFEPSVYLNFNLPCELDKSLKEKFPHFKSDLECFEHFYHETKNCNLRDTNRFRIKNANDIQMINNKWNALYKAIDNKVKFDLSFYVRYYDIPCVISSRFDVFMYWLNTGLFLGDVPNEHYLLEKDKLINEIIEIFAKHLVDINYIHNEYLNVMVQFMKVNKTPVLPNLENVKNTLFLFLNTGFKLRLFFNSNERVKYIDTNTEMIQNAKIAMQTLKTNEFREKSNAEYAKQKKLLNVKKEKVKFADEEVKLLKPEKLNSIFNLKKLTDKDFIEKFKKCHNLSELKDVAMKIISHEIKRYNDLDINSMEIKKFVVNLIYNMNKANKTNKSEYLILVKNIVVDIMNTLVNDANLVEKVLQDVEFIVSNKQIVSLSKMVYKAMLLVAPVVYSLF
jgi:hypothetical protein